MWDGKRASCTVYWIILDRFWDRIGTFVSNAHSKPGTVGAKTESTPYSFTPREVRTGPAHLQKPASSTVRGGFVASHESSTRTEFFYRRYLFSSSFFHSYFDTF